MKLAINFAPSNEDWESPVAYVVEAERLGIDMAWTVETWGYDAATPLAYLAAKTTRMQLGTGIMQIGTRTPAMTAMTAMALASACWSHCAEKCLQRSSIGWGWALG